MIKLLHRLRHYYDNLKIQTKFTLCILIAVVVPILALVTIFSGQLYDMVIADTIRNEQEASIRTAPLIERTLSGITKTHEQITSLPYYQTLFEEPVSVPLVALAQSDDAYRFSSDVASLAGQNGIAAVRIYLDLPADNAFFFFGYSAGSVSSDVLRKRNLLVRHFSGNQKRFPLLSRFLSRKPGAGTVR